MKLLFTADIHIKLGQKNVPIDWAKNRYDLLFRSICNNVKKYNAEVLVLGGDIFDKVPSIEELELFFEFIMRITASNIETIIYSGNHEAVKKNTTFLTNLKEIVYNISCSSSSSRIHILDNYKTMYGVDFIPYNKLKEYDPRDVDFHSKILCTHVRGEILPHVKPEIPLELLDRWDVVLAGDLHSYSNSQRNILYPGSPITTSFHRSEVETGVILLDTETLEHEWITLDLPQLLKKTIQVGDPMPKTEYHHTIYEVEGHMEELFGIEDSELLDKKLVQRDTETSLSLDSNMTVVEELNEYLLNILMLPEDVVMDVLEEFNDTNTFNS